MKERKLLKALSKQIELVRNRRVLVIHEYVKEYEKSIVIGVADSIEKAHDLIKEYYGNFTVIEYKDIRDSDLEYQKTIEVTSTNNKKYQVIITLEWFKLNKC